VESESLSPLEAPRFSMRWLLVWVAVIAAVCAVLTYPYRREKFDRTIRAAIANETEAIRTTLGRAPRDQQELEALLGRPMPSAHDILGMAPIRYHRTGENSFILRYDVYGTDNWTYDSSYPEAGWIWVGL